MSSLQAIQLLTTAARISREEQESFSKEGITKKLQDIKYLSSQKKVPRLSLRKEIIHLENQLQGVLELDERFARQKDKESITVASLKQQIAVLKNKLRAVEDLELDKKVDHLSFLLGEHLARKEIATEIALTETMPTGDVSVQEPGDKHMMSIDYSKKAALLQKRLEALKQELDLRRELGTKNPREIKQIEETIKLFEDKLQQYYEQRSALQQEGAAMEIPVDFKVKHKMLFPQAEVKEEEGVEMPEDVKAVEKMLPLPPPPRMRRRE